MDRNGVHVSKDDGSTWVNCDIECPIPSLVCMTPSSRCMAEGIMQVCDEMLQDVHVARWCVYQYKGKSVHRHCPKSCKDDRSVKIMRKDYSGKIFRDPCQLCTFILQKVTTFVKDLEQNVMCTCSPASCCSCVSSSPSLLLLSCSVDQETKM